MPERRQAVEFLRRRLANAILCGDDGTATRLRQQLDGLLNERLAEAKRADGGARPVRSRRW